MLNTRSFTIIRKVVASLIKIIAYSRVKVNSDTPY